LNSEDKVKNLFLKGYPKSLPSPLTKGEDGAAGKANVEALKKEGVNSVYY
jgi:hypothetical protein